MICAAHGVLCCPDDQDEKNEMDGACGTQGGRSDAYRVLVGKPKERYHLEDLDIDGKIALKFI
jgi:hypothetical protein